MGRNSGGSGAMNPGEPMAHTVTHELAHATWNSHLTGANQRAAGKEIRQLYKTWVKDKKKKGYGKYATPMSTSSGQRLSLKPCMEERTSTLNQ